MDFFFLPRICLIAFRSLAKFWHSQYLLVIRLWLKGTLQEEVCVLSKARYVVLGSKSRMRM